MLKPDQITNWWPMFRLPPEPRFDSFIQALGYDSGQALADNIGDDLEGTYGGSFALVDFSSSAWVFTEDRLCAFCAEVRRSNARFGCMLSDLSAALSAYIHHGPIVYLCHAGLIDFVMPIRFLDADAGDRHPVCGVFVGGQYLPTRPDYWHFKQITKAYRLSQARLVGYAHRAATPAGPEAQGGEGPGGLSADPGGAWPVASVQTLRKSLKDFGKVLRDRALRNGRREIGFSEEDVDRLVEMLHRESGAYGALSVYPSLRERLNSIVLGSGVNSYEAMFGGFHTNGPPADTRLRATAFRFSDGIPQRQVECFDLPADAAYHESWHREVRDCLQMTPFTDHAASRKLWESIRSNQRDHGKELAVLRDDACGDVLPHASLASRAMTIPQGGAGTRIYGCMALESNPRPITFEADSIVRPGSQDADSAFEMPLANASEIGQLLQRLPHASAEKAEEHERVLAQTLTQCAELLNRFGHCNDPGSELRTILIQSAQALGKSEHRDSPEHRNLGGFLMKYVVQVDQLETLQAKHLYGLTKVLPMLATKGLPYTRGEIAQIERATCTPAYP